MTDLPIIIDQTGLVPTPPADLRARLVALVTATNPGFTDNLPGSLVEDIVSTDVGALAVCDSARVELVDSLTPYGANEPLLLALGNVYGTALGEQTNTSALLVFTGTVGFIIPRGFTVSDGTTQFIVQDGGIVASGGSSIPIFAVATTPGALAIPANTITQVVTSVPDSITLSVTNPNAATPGADSETWGAYRARVLNAGLSASQGMTRYLKTLLQAVPGVQPRLISVRQVAGGWEVIVGGGDPYDVANAIFTSVFDIPSLTGSTIAITAVTKANPGVATTDLNHGLTSGDSDVMIAHAAGGGFTAINGGPYTVTVIDEKRFSFAIDTSGYSGSYTASSGVVTPNTRNEIVAINDYPDTYNIPFVVPPQQSVAVSLSWSTTATNFIFDDAVAQTGAEAIAGYINSIAVGVPINEYEMQLVFLEAIEGILSPQFISDLTFVVSINGIVTSPDMGTALFSGDPESYFLTSSAAITVARV